MGDEGFYAVGVVYHPGHELARLLVVVVLKGKGLQLVVNLKAHIGHKLPGGDMGIIRTYEGENPLPHIHNRQNQTHV
jgi:hypothetical protein